MMTTLKSKLLNSNLINLHDPETSPKKLINIFLLNHYHHTVVASCLTMFGVCLTIIIFENHRVIRK